MIIILEQTGEADSLVPCLHVAKYVKAPIIHLTVQHWTTGGHSPSPQLVINSVCLETVALSVLIILSLTINCQCCSYSEQCGIPFSNLPQTFESG